MSFATAMRLLRSSTFRLALVYMAVFAVSVTVLLGFLWQATVGTLMEQMDETIRADIKGLNEQYAAGGAAGIARIITARLRRDPGGRTVYLLTDPLGRPLVGNVGAWPDAEPDDGGWMTFALVDRRSPEGRPHLARAMPFTLDGGLRLLVGREVHELEQTRRSIKDALVWGVLITLALALAGGIALSRGTARRIEAINQTSREIMTGDLSRRIPVGGSGDDFDQLAGNLNDMLDRIQTLMEGLRHVSDNIAHDLRTPLSRLRSRLEALEDGAPESAERRRRVAAAISEADGLIAVFNALMRIARIEAGGRRESFGPVDLGAVVRDVAELYEPLAQEGGLGFSVDAAAAAEITGDRDLVFQAVANLVDNAVKYTPARGAIGIAARLGDVIVWDTGPGIPEESREAVFERFRRLDASRSEPGSGLGLALVRAVVRLHGGGIELADNHPGLRVTLSLA